MNIIRAKTSGFCFGVKKAVDTAYAVSEQNATAQTDDLSKDRSGGPVYMFGELIHNRQVTRDLIERGLRQIESPSELPQGGEVLIRAHGISPKVRDALLRREARIIDCTCPYVRKIHQIVSKAHADGAGILITGTRNHPEVLGINGACDDQAIIIEHASEVESLELEDRAYVLVSQTTHSVDEFDKTVTALKKKIANLQIFDTICITTERRQAEARSIARAVDVMLVIGSRNSSNTRKLFEVCLSECGETYLIEQPDDVKAVMAGRETTNLSVGLTAGASTPERMIREVILTMSENEAMQNQQEQVDFSFSDFIDNIPQLKRGATVKGRRHYPL